MALARGAQLGSYEILGPLGAGGMGEVYRGRDKQLGRDVAVKTLPVAFAHDADRLARFEREAQVLAMLNHPNLAIIHELKEVSDSKYLILELVEGETLAERIARGPIPLDEALHIAKQMADALEAAHDKGIVHRDLKPANVKITPEGLVKVLDFGLAKIYQAAGAPQDLSNSPTFGAAETATGTVLGTAPYMSPEQARGKEVDRRTDVWAFGCVLYEMLTGRQAFPRGETVSDTLAGILAREPEWQALPAGTPSRIRALLERCLRKDVRRRWSGVADVRNEIEEARGEREASAVRPALPPVSRRLEHVLSALALIFFVITLGMSLGLYFRPAPEAPTLQSELYWPAGSPSGSLSLAELSPDGRKLAFLASTGGKRLIFVRPLDSTPQALTGTEGTGTEIFWSADSESIGFFAEGKLKKIAASGGPSQVVGSLPAGGHSGTWSSEGVILLGAESSPAGPLLRVPAAGGQPAAASELDASRKETTHAYPHFLPDGRHYLYLARSSDTQNPTAANVGELDSKERRPLPGIASEVKYTSGHVIFIRDGALMAQPFDPRKLSLSGDAFPVAGRIVRGSAVSGPFSVSTNGSLAYFKAPGSGQSGDFSMIVNVLDRAGQRIGEAGPEFQVNQEPLSSSGGPQAGIFPHLAELSPDKKQLAFSRGAPPDIWVLDIEKRLTSPFTRHPAADSFPVWSPDGTRIAFRSERNGPGNLYERAVGVVGEDKLLLQDEADKFPTDWSRDGRYLAYYTRDGDIFALPLSGGSVASKPLRVTQTPFIETGAKISPDGRWVAYVSTEPGRNEIYVQSFPEPGFKQQVSTAGGGLPRWSADGKELFYVWTVNGTVMAVATKAAGTTLSVGAPSRLFGLRGPVYDVSTGGRFFMGVAGTGAGAQLTPPHIVHVLNWAAGLKGKHAP